MKRHDVGEASVIPVILRSVDWRGAPFGKLQALPKDANPVTSWANRDEAFTDVAQGIRRAIEKLAANPQEFRHQSGSRPRIWNVPHGQNPHFVGRDAMLDAVHETLAASRTAALTAVFGMGGVGKTSIATEYAYRRAAEYEIVWWVRAEESSSIAADLTLLAAAFDLPEREARETPVVIEAVWRALNGRTNWLLVFDNASGADALDEFLPQSRSGHILITSRDPNWGRFAQKLEVKMLSPEDAVAFLGERTGQTDGQAAGELAETLGRLPLALEQAAAYIEAAGETLAGYLKLFRTRHHELWPDEKPPANYPDTVATTWLISFAEAEQQSPAAADLLRLCAFLAPDDIPIEMLRESKDHLPEPLAAAVADEIAFNKMIAALRRYSLIERQKDSLSVHRLIQLVTRDRMAVEMEKTMAEAAVNVMNNTFPRECWDVQTWPVCARLLHHTLTAAEHGEASSVAVDATGRLFNDLGVYLRGRAQYVEAKRFYERALKSYETALGESHPYVATAIDNLGNTLMDLGKYEAARHCFERALRIDEAFFGSDHPSVARDLNSIGGVLKVLGRLDEARQIYERALRINEVSFGYDHPNVARVVNNLGTALHDLGELIDARHYYERALRIDEASFGSHHPNVAIRVNNLGRVLHDLRKLDEARDCFERALSLGDAALGPDHPQVALYVNNLGGVLKDLGKLNDARHCFERALRIFMASLGEGHPNTIRVRKNLESLG